MISKWNNESLDLPWKYLNLERLWHEKYFRHWYIQLYIKTLNLTDMPWLAESIHKERYFFLRHTIVHDHLLYSDAL